MLQVCNLTLIMGIRIKYDDDPECEYSLSEEHLKDILKRPYLKSLELDFEWDSCDLIVVTNVLSVQIQLGTLEKLSITFNWFTKPAVSNNNIKLLLEALFKLPQISQFSFYFDARLSMIDLEILQTIYKYMQCKKLKEFCYGHFLGLTITENIQCLIDEMQLSVHKECCNLQYPKCYDCSSSEHIKLCTPSLL